MDKYDLLVRFSEALGREDVSVVPDDTVRIDRSLSGLAFEEATGYHAPAWDEMLSELAAEVRNRKE
jgi:dTDP-4-dehydrorhamnose reductase